MHSLEYEPLLDHYGEIPQLVSDSCNCEAKWFQVLLSALFVCRDIVISSVFLLVLKQCMTKKYKAMHSLEAAV